MFVQPFNSRTWPTPRISIRALEQELAAAKRGSSSLEPASGSKRPQEGAEQSSASEPPAKRVRLPVKTPASQVVPPSDSRTLFQKAMDSSLLPQKVLGTNCPVTASSQATTKWISGLKLSNAKREELQQACKNACNTIRTLSEEDQEVLAQRAADFGFPVRNLTLQNPWKC